MQKWSLSATVPQRHRLQKRRQRLAKILSNPALRLCLSLLLGIALMLGLNLAPLLAGAGIIGLAISFASQNVIRDMINGFLILLEDQFGVGDVIVVGDVAGIESVASKMHQTPTVFAGSSRPSFDQNPRAGLASF